MPEREFSIQLSEQEIVALVKYHMTQSKRISRKFGEGVLKIQGQSPFGGTRQMFALKKVCEDEINTHQARAKGLLSLVK